MKTKHPQVVGSSKGKAILAKKNKQESSQGLRITRGPGQQVLSLGQSPLWEQGTVKPPRGSRVGCTWPPNAAHPEGVLPAVCSIHTGLRGPRCLSTLSEVLSGEQWGPPHSTPFSTRVQATGSSRRDLLTNLTVFAQKQVQGENLAGAQELRSPLR